jgi:hypothetical protein
MLFANNDAQFQEKDLRMHVNYTAATLAAAAL